MSTLPNEHSKIELAMFDSFSKSVMRHCSSKLATAADKIHQSEILNLYEDQCILEIFKEEKMNHHYLLIEK